MKQVDDKAFIDTVRRQLDDSVERLAPEVSERLDDMRRAALAQPAGMASDEHDRSAEMVESIRVSLEDSEALPAEIQQRLDHVRHQAMARYQRRKPGSPLQRLRDSLQSLLESSLSMPTGMVATALVMVTAVSLFYVSSRPPGSLSVDEEISLIASAEDLELYENLEFYLWLADNGLPD